MRQIGRRQYKLTQIRKKQAKQKAFSKEEKVKFKKFKPFSHNR
jgi:hypothetical protein